MIFQINLALPVSATPMCKHTKAYWELWADMNPARGQFLFDNMDTVIRFADEQNQVGDFLGSAADGWGFSRLRFSDFIENWLFWGSGRPLGALEPSKKAVGETPHLSWMVLKPQGAAQTPKMTDFQSNH